MDEVSERALSDALGRIVEQDRGGDPAPAPKAAGRECFRILATVARTGQWSADDARHRDSCPYCKRTGELIHQAAAQPPAPACATGARGYASLEPSRKRQIDVAVVQSLLDVRTPRQIARTILREQQVRLTPRQIREIVHRARKNGEFVYKVENDRRLEKLLQEKFGLMTVRVVRCTGLEPITRWGADALRSILADVLRTRLTLRQPATARVGIAGGPTVFSVMSACGNLLENDGFDGEVVVDAMLPGAFWLHMNYDGPHWPRFQFQNYWEATRHLPETNYGGHFIPPMVSTTTFQRLMANEKAIADTVRSVNDLDVILTSGAVWDDPHGASQLKRYYADPEKVRRERGLVGELLWHPLNERGPVRMDLVPVTSLGLEGLERLPNLIRQGTRVLAVLGPCVMCKARKARLVKTLLRLREPIITDLVIDAPSAEEVVADLSGEGRGARPDTPGAG
jgi:DNA-binding transcriptional regulator LsrR (DeoR family)